MRVEIEKFNACKAGLRFRSKYATFAEAWDACPRGDWMLWIASQLNVDDKKLFLAMGLCAETAIDAMKDARSIDAVNKAIAYANGLLDRDSLIEANKAAEAAYSEDSYSASAYLGYAVSAVTEIEDNYHDAAAEVAEQAAIATCSLAKRGTYVATRKANEKRTADICREILTDVVLEKISKL